jgi:hypothetical protein
MANDGKFLNMEGGLPKQESAIAASAGAGDANKIPKLDASGRLDGSMMPVGLGAETKTLTASEALTAGNIVNIWNDAGTPKVRKADATAAGKQAHGFVLANVANAAQATVYLEGNVTGLAGMTPGANQFLSAATPGARVEVAPSAAGNVAQLVGIAVSATEMTFEPNDAIVLA